MFILRHDAPMSRFLIFFTLLFFAAMPAFANWQEGERLTFDVYFGFLKAGQAEFLYAPTADEKGYQLGVRAWTSEGTGTLFTLRDRIFIEGVHTPEAPFLPTRAVRELNENNYHANKVMQFTHKQAQTQVSYTNKLAQTPPETYMFETHARDVFSAMYALRGRSKGIQVGEELTLPVAELDHPYTLVLTVAEKTTLNTHAGETEVWHLKPRLFKGKERNETEGKWNLWVTADGTYTPVLIKVKMNFGGFTAKLSDKAPASAPSQAPEGLPLTGKIVLQHLAVCQPYLAGHF